MYWLFMAHVIEWLQRHFPHIYKGTMLIISVFLIVQLFPRQPGFDYEYQQARPWMYDDLIAPFSFAVLKTTQELEKDREQALAAFYPLFEKQQDVALQQMAVFREAFQLAWKEQFPDGGDTRRKETILLTGIQILDSVFERGVLLLEDDIMDGQVSSNIRLIDGRVADLRRLEEFFTLRQAFRYMVHASEMFEAEPFQRLLLSALEEALAPNVYFNRDMTGRARDAALDNIPVSRGMVQQGEKIVSKGELVTSETHQILESFKAEYQRQAGSSAATYLLYLGQFLLVSISVVVLMLFLFVFRKEVFDDNRRILLILLSVFLMVFLTSQVVRINVQYLFLVPVCIVPIVIRAFFDNRLALYVHINTIILIGFLVPRSFEFVFLQFIAGIIAILSMVSLRRRSQLFSTVMLIFLTYSAVFFGLSLAHTGSLDAVDWINIVYFLGASTLTLFAYPLIFMFERLFGLPTDFSLLELADINNKLLRQLGLIAPGTFQHSLQVANLAEEAIYEIGGNSLLTRTGALYHDIGKMDNPGFFTENQAAGINPHDELSYEESAGIIINHVIKGIEKARRHNLPEYLIDFIRTHHGTTTARYFYSMEIKERGDGQVDSKLFTYPGPRPFSKETAVVMMADSVEAASRSLGNHNENSINELVDTMIDTQIKENQFEHANITFRDISTIKKLFKRRLMNIYHVRIAYPSRR
jgi:cyclic-di-AMP phosphodiesterase PgpH